MSQCRIQLKTFFTYFQQYTCMLPVYCRILFKWRIGGVNTLFLSTHLTSFICRKIISRFIQWAQRLL